MSHTECDEARKLEQASHSKITIIVLCIFFASLLSSGIGQTAVATLGIPYIDDNVASKQSPIYMGKYGDLGIGKVGLRFSRCLSEIC